MDTSSVPSSTQRSHPSTIAEPNDYHEEGGVCGDFTKIDVLSGRGGLSNHHLGNRVFRSLIQRNKELYRQSDSKRNQGLVIRSIMQAMEEQGSRFLKHEIQTGRWLPMDENQICLKIRQALRGPDINKASAASVMQKRQKEEQSQSRAKTNRTDPPNTTTATAFQDFSDADGSSSIDSKCSSKSQDERDSNFDFNLLQPYFSAMTNGSFEDIDIHPRVAAFFRQCAIEAPLNGDPSMVDRRFSSSSMMSAVAAALNEYDADDDDDDEAVVMDSTMLKKSCSVQSVENMNAFLNTLDSSHQHFLSSTLSPIQLDHERSAPCPSPIYIERRQSSLNRYEPTLAQHNDATMECDECPRRDLNPSLLSSGLLLDEIGCLQSDISLAFSDLSHGIQYHHHHHSDKHINFHPLSSPDHVQSAMAPAASMPSSLTPNSPRYNNSSSSIAFLRSMKMAVCVGGGEENDQHEMQHHPHHHHHHPQLQKEQQQQQRQQQRLLNTTSTMNANTHRNTMIHHNTPDAWNEWTTRPVSTTLPPVDDILRGLGDDNDHHDKPEEEDTLYTEDHYRAGAGAGAGAGGASVNVNTAANATVESTTPNNNEGDDPCPRLAAV